MKLIHITPHAKERITARKLRLELVKATVRYPDQIIPDENDIKRQIYQSLFTNHKGKQKLLRVVVEETQDEIAVFTVYLTSQIKKYWKIKE